MDQKNLQNRQRTSVHRKIFYYNDEMKGYQQNIEEAKKLCKKFRTVW